MSQILKYLTSQQEAMVSTLAQWVNQDSPTYNKPAVDTMGQATAQAFIEAGATLSTTHTQKEMGNHYTLSYGNAQSQILTLCHFDTVWPMDEAKKRPFTIEDNRATGPGIHDMKAGTLIALFALKAIRHFQLKPRHKLVYMLTSDEEISSPTSRLIIEAEGKKSSYCLVPEGSHNKSILTTSRKGVGRFNLEITGKAAHAGVEPQNGVSAIDELARQIQVLHALNDFERGVTVNVGVVSGGERPNIVAPFATAQADLRVATQADGDELSRQILNLQPQLPGSKINVSGGITRPPFVETPAGLALFQKAQDVARELGFSVERFNSGGGSDGSFVAALGVPTLDGMGSLGGGAHALHEHILLNSLPLRAALMAELIMQL